MESENELETMLEDCKKNHGYELLGKIIQSSDLLFEERVKMNCFYCGKYDHVWKCPPKIPNIDFQKLLQEYSNLAFVYVKKKIDEDNYEEIRKGSSIELHRGLLACERWLYEHNNTLAISFIGGSCKLCRNGCAPERCANPYQSRTPIEAIGVNVVKSAQKVGIQIIFPPDEYLMRIGLLLW